MIIPDRKSRGYFFLPALPNVTRFKCQGYVGIYVDSALNVNIPVLVFVLLKSDEEAQIVVYINLD